MPLVSWLLRLAQTLTSTTLFFSAGCEVSTVGCAYEGAGVEAFSSLAFQRRTQHAVRPQEQRLPSAPRAMTRDVIKTIMDSASSRSFWDGCGPSTNPAMFVWCSVPLIPGALGSGQVML